jgi:triosephosphate isomerase
MAQRTPFVGGNWKMNLDRARSAALASEVARIAATNRSVEVAVFPPALYLSVVESTLGGGAATVGGQDCSAEKEGAFTVGETLAERESGRAHDVIRTQLHGTLSGHTLDAASLVIAYEPVWAIGTGRTATPDDAAEAHRTVRQTLADLYDVRFSESVRVIYGGSVNAKNAAELFTREEIDGGLVGGASLIASDFAAIVAAAAAKVTERSN